MATFLLEAASAAEGDQALARVLETIGVPQELILHTLTAMRRERDAIHETARLEARRAGASDQDRADLGD
jgi:hypothetical protein